MPEYIGSTVQHSGVQVELVWREVQHSRVQVVHSVEGSTAQQSTGRASEEGSTVEQLTPNQGFQLYQLPLQSTTEHYRALQSTPEQ